jgi:pimeloyl-ACP methyl ester carboxylesterase
VPLTVAWGDKERLIPAKARRRDELPAHTRFLTLADCGHSPVGAIRSSWRARSSRAPTRER